MIGIITRNSLDSLFSELNQGFHVLSCLISQMKYLGKNQFSKSYILFSHEKALQTKFRKVNYLIFYLKTKPAKNGQN
jgi:hypothetical protein